MAISLDYWPVYLALSLAIRKPEPRGQRGFAPNVTKLLAGCGSSRQMAWRSRGGVDARASALSTLLECTMPLRPTKMLLAAACIVGASTAALPGVTGYGTILFQLVAFGAWGFAASVTSGRYVDTHHALLWSVALALNLAAFLIPAAGIWLAAHKRWPAVCSVAILVWCLFYLLSLFWLFPATDGP